MKEARRIKELGTKMRILREENSKLRTLVKTSNKSIQSNLKLIGKYDKEAKAIEQTGGVKVTEHAMLRYLERVMGVNLSELEEKIVTADLSRMIDSLGDGTYPEHGKQVVVKDNKIVTIK